MRRTALAAAYASLALGPVAYAAGPDQFQITVERTGSPETVFTWDHDRCDDTDSPDAPVRAFRDSAGNVHLMIASSETTRFMVGHDLGSVHRDCSVAFHSLKNDAPQAFADREWMASTYTQDGATIQALVHDEFQGNHRPALCPSKQYSRCWQNAITASVSHDGGAHFSEPMGSEALVASPPYPYQGDRGFPVGYVNPTNIVLKDGFYYTLFGSTSYRDQTWGYCLMRTKTLTDPASWRAWDGADFTIAFVNPYDPAAAAEPAKHVCAPVSRSHLMSIGSITRDRATNAFVATMSNQRSWTAKDPKPPGVYLSASADLIHWSEAVPVWTRSVDAAGKVVQLDAIPAMLDPQGDRNFETTGAAPFIYYVQFPPGFNPYNRSLLRQAVHLTIKPLP